MEKDQLPRATHSGTWIIDEEGAISVQCYVMDNGERVLSLRGAARAMGLSEKSGATLVRNLSATWIGPYLSEPLRDWLTRVICDEQPEYISDGGKRFTPFEATLFVDLCKAYVDAMHDDALKTAASRRVAERLYLIMTAFAKTGLIAVIDEVTGYQDDRDRQELQKILSHYISEELMLWTKRFPDEFYKQMFRLKGWDYRGKTKPSCVGALTNEYIYQYLPDEVLAELRQKNPRDNSTKKSRYRPNQFLAVDTGARHLDNQLQQTIALMKASDTWEEFDKLFKRVMGEPCQEKLDKF